MSAAAINELIARAGQEPASYTHEVILQAADWYAEQLGETHDTVWRMRRSLHVVGMVIGLDAQREWERQRRQLPWWSRMLQPGEVPAQFKADFIELQRSRARTDFIAARRTR